MIFRSILLQVRKEKAKNMRTFTFSTGLHPLQDVSNRKRRQLQRYIVQAFLQNNRAFATLWCSRYMHTYFLKELDTCLERSGVGFEYNGPGGSLWLERVDD